MKNTRAKSRRTKAPGPKATRRDTHRPHTSSVFSFPASPVRTRIERIVGSPHSAAGHSFILAGPRGAGTEELAGLLIAGFACHTPLAGQACGDCPSCALMRRPQHPDVYVVDPEETSVGIDDIRTMLRWLDHRPMVAKRRTCSIRHADRLTEEAANALLKTLEEPTADTKILLTAEHLSALPATVVSRCTVLPVPLLSYQDVADSLVAGGQTPTQAARIAGVSQGRIAFAHFLAQHPAALENLIEDTAIFTHILRAPLHERLRLSESLSERVEQQPSELFERWETIARSMVLASAGISTPGPTGEQARTIAEGWSPQRSSTMLSLLIAARRQLSISNNPRLTLETLFLQLPV